LPLYESKAKRIYIDPPYNTRNEGWIYNDNVIVIEGGLPACLADRHLTLRVFVFINCEGLVF
jgi:hypothetical protein